MANLRPYIVRWNPALTRLELRARGRSTIFVGGTDPDAGWSDSRPWDDAAVWSDN